MKALEQIRSGVDLLAVAWEVVKHLDGLFEKATRENAADALTVARVMIKTLLAVGDGAVTPEKVRDEMAKLSGALDAGDTKADAALDEKFGGKS
jgi:hypothetical protein